MKQLLLAILYFFSAYTAIAQKSPFEKYGPYGAMIYKDLKLALKTSDDVLKMDLSYQTIDPKLFSKIGKLKNLHALQLSSNSISTWPSDFNKLTSLQFFSSINNDFTSFPPNLKDLSSLMFLDFYGCKIDSIPDEIAYLNKLVVLRVGNTDDTLRITNKMKWMRSISDVSFEHVILDSCPKQLFRIPTLKVLCLSNTKTQALPQNFDALGNLEVLIVENNFLTAVPRGIYKCKKLVYLSLKNNKLTKIPDTICHLQNLTQLDLRGNTISKADIEEIKALLPGCKVLSDTK